MEKPRQKDDRYRLYKLLEVGKRELRMDDDSFRAMLARHGATEKDGHPSRQTMSIPDLDAALREMRAKGFKPRPRRGRARNMEDWRAERIKKITALWCALADAGVVHNRSEKAMVAWCAGITKKARLQWTTTVDLNNCIEGLKRWAAREGVKLDG